MNITYIVGNGFDCGLGLNTDYISFIDWYLRQPESDKEAVRRMRATISTNKSTWADAEMAMATLPFSEFGGDVRQTAMDCLHDFSGHLSTYIKAKESLVVLPHDPNALKQLQSQFGRFFLDVFRDGDESWFPWEDINTNEVIFITVVSLNYSHVLDRLIPQEPIEYRDLNAHNVCTVKFLPVCHLHGEVDPGMRKPPSFGVGYEEQIADPNLRRYSSKFGYLLKPKFDSGFSYDKYEQVQATIRNSEYIVLFGTSLGQSDMYLWITLLKEFFRNKTYGGAMKLLNSVFRRNFKGIPEIVEFQEKSDAMLSQYLWDYGEMPGMREDLKDAIFTVGVGPFKTPDGETVYFDPLRLTWLRHMLNVGD